MRTIHTIWACGLGLLLTFCVAVELQADNRKWELDKDHANVYFLVDHIFAKIGGYFQDFTITADIDPDNLEKGSFFCEIKVASISTGQSKRDQHLRTADFFDAENHPVIRFTSTSIHKEGDTLYTIKGQLEVKGQQHELHIPLRLSSPKKHPAMPDKEVLGFNGAVTMDRLALGIGDGSFYKAGLVGKDVELFITFEMLADLAQK